jgi:hypothetical protein
MIPSIFKNRVEVKWMTPFLLMELSVFRVWTGDGEVFSGKVMFLDIAPVNAGDTSNTVNEHSGVDSFQGMQGFNELYWDLHGGSRGYNYSSYLGNRRVLCQWRSPF